MIKYLIYTPPLNIMSANVPECLTFSMSPNLALFATTGEGLLTSSLIVNDPIELDFPHPISANQVQLMLTKILWEEYGAGKIDRKHSSHFAAMLEELELDSTPEAYLDIVPWEVLANINHSFLLSEQKRKFLRYVVGLLFIEVSVPASFQNWVTTLSKLPVRSMVPAGVVSLTMKMKTVKARQSLQNR